MVLHSKGIFFIYIVLFSTLVHHSSVLAGGVNGGTVCLGCTAVVSISQQLAEHWNTTFSNAYGRLCSYLPSPFGTACSVLGKFFLPAIIPYQNLTADVICHSIKLCYTDKGQSACKLHPKSKLSKNFAKTVEKIRKSIKEKKILQEVYNDFVEKPTFDVCDIPVVKEVCKFFDHVGSGLPILDFDGDRFSSYSSLRGYSWRGKDCNDFLKTHHPGRKPISDDVFFDSNCNGISGFNVAKWKSWEEILCKDTGAQGTIVLGDSIAAHFHIPPPWLTATEINQTVFQNLLFVLENEFDWPMMGAFTAFLNQTDWPQVISGPVDSVYKHVVTRNLCNHRDYQNIGKNGADSFDMNNILVKALARNNETDYPALVFYSLFGNDVCNSSPSPENMTTPEEMKTNALKTMDTLDKMLPNGSHVVMLGLADGKILYESMHNRIHPIGKLRKDITYSTVYDYLNCLQISPCAGWLNSNATIRNATTKRANELSQVLENIAETHKYKNFDLTFIPHDLDEAIKMWKESGKDHETWQLIEPVDGFHPNQNGLALIAKFLVQTMESKFPHFLGKVNPNNHIIKKLFGNQGGYNYLNENLI